MQIVSGQIQQLNITLSLQSEQEQVTVSGEALALNTTSSANASAVVSSEKELEALPDDPDGLQQDLEALAGPSAGPNGGQMYIDGFTAGQLPPKSSIREIRINQSPFAAEYDRIGYGRIEIFTEPGTDKWHGQVSVNKNNAFMDARDPFATTSAGFDSTQIEASVGGPLNKNASLSFNLDDRDISDQSLVTAITLAYNCNQGSVFQQITCSQAVGNPRRRLNGGPRIDYQLGKNNTLSGRYQYFRNNSTDAGIGGLILPTAAFNVPVGTLTSPLFGQSSALSQGFGGGGFGAQTSGGGRRLVCPRQEAARTRQTDKFSCRPRSPFRKRGEPDA